MITLVFCISVLSNQYTRPALVVGGSPSESHIEIGNNQIQGKESYDKTAGLYLNEGGGLVIIGIDGLRVTGNVEIEGNLVVKGSIESESKMK